MINCSCGKVRAGEPYTLDQCRLCWLRVHGAPSLIRQALNLSKAVVRHVNDGFAQVSEDDYAARLAACNSPCESLRDGRCLECGCFVAAKARWRSENCPLQKWPV